MPAYGKPEAGGDIAMKIDRRAAALFVCLLAACATKPPSVPPDLVLYNGKIVTVDPSFSIAQAVAIGSGRFVAVGTNDAVRQTAGPATRQMDLGGRTVIPGLMDGHLHNAGGGAGLNLARVRSIDELLAAVEAGGEQAGPDEVIVPDRDWHDAH